jgi:hypothetical protein
VNGPRSNLFRAALTLIVVLAAGSATAQLNDHCVVSVLNRATTPDANGAWILTDIPSNFGAVRARATCTENGVTRFGQSGYFEVKPDGIVSDVVIAFDSPVSVPNTLSLNAPTTSIQKTGDSTQIAITATMADGTTKDLTTDPGTTYRTTNPNVATVSPNGVVTAQGSGVALISVVNEGAIGVIRISVAGVLDSDGDGMPDDWEIANGLNPNDPSDASKDPDGDGLTNLQEYQQGTNPHLADTDGDGINDGLEVQTGSNPLDPASYNLARALRGLHFTPPNVVLVVNSIVGTASRTVRVVGDLIDGSTVDLTARARGTNYTIADGSVATLTAVDGEITAVRTGGTVLTVTNSGFSASASIAVSSFAPVPLSFLAMPGYANSVRVAGNFCYVAAGAAGLQIVDVTDRTAPRITGAYDTAGNADDVRVVGTTAYIADGTNGLVIVNVAVPSNPTLLAQFNTGGEARALVVSGGRAYIANGNAGLAIVDVSNPAAPALAGRYNDGVFARGIDVQNGTAVLATIVGVTVLDVSNPAAPVLRGAVATTNAQALKLYGSAAFLADYTGSLLSIDPNAAGGPRVLGSTASNSGGILNDVDVVNDFAFGADVGFFNGVPITYVANPSSLQVRGQLNFPYRDDNGMGVAADATYVYLVAASVQLTKPGISGTTALYIGQYVAVDDAFGIAPRATLTGPAAGSSFIEGTSFTMTADASDDVAVSAVSFYIDDKLVGTTTAKPYSFSATATVHATSMRLRAQAIDFGGNAGDSPEVVVNVIADTTPPTATLFSPFDGQRIAGNRIISVTGQVTDFESGLAKAELLVNGIVAQTINLPGFFPAFSYTLPPGPATVTFALRATDRAGNATTSATATVTVFVDQPPTVSFALTLPPGGVLYGGGELPISGTASDDLGVSKMDVIVDGSVVKTFGSTTSFNYTLTIPTGVTTTTVTVRATDTAGQTATAPGRTVQVSPTFALSSVLTAGYANHAAVQGAYAYVAVGAAGLQVIDVSNPDAAAVVATLPLPGNANSVVVRGAWAFIAAGTAGLQTISVADPHSPQLAGSLPLNGIAEEIVARNDRVYVSDETALNIVDVSNPRVPRLISRYTTPIMAVRAFAINDVAAVVVSDHDRKTSSDCFHCTDVTVLNLSDEGHPQTAGTITVQPRDWANVSLDGTRAYIGGYDALNTNQMFVIDLSNPSSPALLGVFDPNFARSNFRDISPVGDLALVASSETKGVASILSVATPGAIRFLGGINFNAFGTYFGTSITATPELVYTSGSTVRFLDGTLKGTTQGPSGFYIGRYRTIHDTAALPPQVATDAPIAGAAVFERAVLPIRVRATDDVGVKSVTFTVDGQVIATTTTAPFEVYYDVPPGGGTHTVGASATDFGGNTASATPVTFSAVADTTPPTVRLVSPVDGEGILGGTTRMTAVATDNFSVAKVEFFVNGQLVATRTNEPYRADYTIPAGAQSVAIFARATDPAGNTADSATATVTSFSPTTLATLSLPDTARSIAISGSYAYVGATTAGVQVVDVSDPARPQVIAAIPTASHLRKVRVLGNLLYLGEETTPYEIYDVSNPAAPVRVATGVFSGGLVAPTGTFLYIAGVSQIDVSNPAAPLTLSTAFVNGVTYDALDASDNMAAAEYTSGGFLSTAHTLSGYVFRNAVTAFGPNVNLTAYDIKMRNSYVMAATGRGLAVLDVADHFLWQTSVSDSLMQLGGGAFGNAPSSIDAADHYIAAVDSGSSTVDGVKTVRNAVVIFDAAAPRDPQIRSFVTYSSGASVDAPQSVALTPTLLVTAADAPSPDGGSTPGPHRLYITQYRRLADSRNIAPTVVLTAPVAATTAKAGRLLNIRATADDDVAVARVVFAIDGVDIGTDVVAPYETNFLVPNGRASVTVSVRAIDYGGNVSAVQSLTIPVTP